MRAILGRVRAALRVPPPGHRRCCSRTPPRATRYTARPARSSASPRSPRRPVPDPCHELVVRVRADQQDVVGPRPRGHLHVVDVVGARDRRPRRRHRPPVVAVHRVVGIPVGIHDQPLARDLLVGDVELADGCKPASVSRVVRLPNSLLVSNCMLIPLLASVEPRTTSFPVAFFAALSQSPLAASVGRAVAAPRRAVPRRRVRRVRRPERLQRAICPRAQGPGAARPPPPRPLLHRPGPGSARAMLRLERQTDHGVLPIGHDHPLSGSGYEEFCLRRGAGWKQEGHGAPGEGDFTAETWRNPAGIGH